MSKHPPPAPAVSAIGPCPTIIQIIGRPGTGSLPRTIAPPDHPQHSMKFKDNRFNSYGINTPCMNKSQRKMIKKESKTELLFLYTALRTIYEV